MDELETRLVQLKRRAEKALSERAKAIATQEASRARVAEIVRELKSRFGVSSIAEAQSLSATLAEQATEMLAEAEALLEVVENG